MANHLRTASFQIFTDTDPAVEQLLIEQIRLLSPERKLQMMGTCGRIEFAQRLPIIPLGATL